jgi:hypothetical protein
MARLNLRARPSTTFHNFYHTILSSTTQHDFASFFRDFATENAIEQTGTRNQGEGTAKTYEERRGW